MKRTLLAFAAVVLLAVSVAGQGTTSHSILGGNIASNYNKWYVYSSTAVASGVATMNFQPAQCIVNASNKAIFPFSVLAPVLISDNNSETVTPTAVVYNASTCSITANFTYAHGANVQVSSGSGGVQEAIDDSPSNGYVWITPDITAVNLAAATITPTVRVFAAGNTDYGYKVTSITPIVIPTAGTFGVAAPSGIPAATYRVAQTCVDPLGGETLISTDSATTVTTTSSNGNITATVPTCATGSVGWRLYISAAAGVSGSEILYNPTAAGCTASSLGIRPSCALTSGSITSALVTGTALVPAQASAYAMAMVPQDEDFTPFLRSWPPFTVTGVQTAGSAYTLSQVNFPAGYLNQLGKTIQVCGNYILTPSATGTDVVTVLGGNTYGVSPTTLVTWTSGALTNAAYEAPFCFTMTIAATGSSGTAEIHGSIKFALASTGVQSAVGYTDANTSTVALGDLTKEVSLYLQSTPGSSNVTQGQMRQFTIQPLN